MAHMADAVVVSDVPAKQRFEVAVDGEVVGFAAYVLEDPDRIVFTHTEVDDEVGGRGIATTLIRGALDAVGHAGQRRVDPQCDFVASFIERHPDYRDLLARA